MCTSRIIQVKKRGQIAVQFNTNLTAAFAGIDQDGVNDATLSIGVGTEPSIGAQSGPPFGRLVPVIHRRDPRAAECPSGG